MPMSCHNFNAERVIPSRVQVLAPMVLKPRPIPIPAEIGFSLRRGRGGYLDCMRGKQTHSEPPGIEPRSLDQVTQPLTIRPFLTRNQNRNHLLLESELESKSWILENPGIGIRIGINPCAIRIGIRITDTRIIYNSVLSWVIGVVGFS